MRKIATVLVANRGEIALRILRTAHELGIRGIAVFSEADEHAPHVQHADDGVCIGPAPVAESYLNGGRIIEAALEKGADAIHPGYGFLSENAEFARAVLAAGLQFIGPPAAAIELMGDKARAKRRMLEAGVPCVPGYEGEEQSEQRFLAAADEIGYPVMVKAAAGGGGRGMRLVGSADELPRALELACSEAENAFGSGVLILEKAIQRPRHVEIQVFGDTHGNVIHLGERDCSVQRRHQKVVEEAPCPVMTPELRQAMGGAAVEAARAVDYHGAGTVEFLLDEAGRFYFLEMNTRLQVEHPVTELVTGLDLVALQIAVAEGQPLPLTQEGVSIQGHAIEVRLYAEDPQQGFLPSTGRIERWLPGAGLRVDGGIASGGEVSPYYDSMVAKLISHGHDREEARRKLVEGLGATALFGPTSNRDFLLDVLNRQTFVDGLATTAFVEETYGEIGWEARHIEPADLAVAALIDYRLRMAAADPDGLVSAELIDWSSARDLVTAVDYLLDGAPVTAHLRPSGGSSYEVRIGEDVFGAQLELLTETAVKLTLQGGTRTAHHHRTADGRLYVALPDRSLLLVPRALGEAGAGSVSGGDGQIVAPMHGLLLEVLVAEGDVVSKGDKLAVLEAMKMQHEILADVDGAVARVVAAAGSQLAADAPILEIAPTQAPDP